MIMIYCPTSMSLTAQEELDRALDMDGARIHYVGNDGVDEFVIVEANNFQHTHKVEVALGLSLAYQKSRATLQPTRRRARSSRRSQHVRERKTR